MSSTIDERIVEMQFDNQQFEHGVKQSIDSLDKLKESLKLEDSSKGLEKLQQATDSFDVSHIEKGVSSLADAFTNFGIIGQTVLQNLTNRVVDMGVKMVKSLSTDLVGAGMSKYEQSLKAVQRIMAATDRDIEDVQAQLDKLMWFTDETSYSFIDMANNIGTFTSFGIGLEDSTKQIIGVATAAGLAGAEVNKASHAMTGFAQAMGRTYMDKQLWNSWIKTAGLQTMKVKQVFIDAAEELGNLKKVAEDTWVTTAKTAKAGVKVTNAEFANELTDTKWLSDKVMQRGLAVFGEYAEEVYKIYNDLGVDTAQAMEIAQQKFDGFDKNISVKAFRMSQEARTFGDAISAVADAVSTNWMYMFQLIFGNYKESVQMWTDMSVNLWEVFVPPIQNITEVLEEWRKNTQEGTGSYKDFVAAISNSFQILAAVADKIHAISKGFLTVTGLEKFTLRFLNFTERVKEYLGITDEAADETVEGIEAVGSAADAANASVEELANTVIKGVYGNGAERRAALEALGVSYAIVQNKVNELLGCEYRHAVTEEDVIKMNGYLAQSNAEVGEGLDELNKDLVNNTEIEYTWAMNLQSTIKGVMAAFDILGQAVTALFRALIPGFEFMGTVASGILGVTGSMGDFVIALDDYLRENDVFYTVLKQIVDLITEFLRPGLDAIKELMESLSNRTNKFTKIFKELSDQIPEFTENAIGKVLDFGKQLIEVFGKVGEKAKELKILETIIGVIALGVSKIMEFLGPIGTAISIMFQGLVESVKNVNLDGITKAFGKLKERFAPAFETFKIFKEYFDKWFINPITSFINKKLPSWWMSFKWYGTSWATAINEFLKSLTGDKDAAQLDFSSFVNAVKSAIEVVSYALQNLGSIASKVGKVVKGAFDVVSEKVKGFVETSSIRDLLGIIEIILGILAVGRIAKILGLVNKFTSAFKGVFESISSYFNSLKMKAFASSAFMFAAAIGIIAFAMYELATKTEPGPLAAAGAAIVSIMIVMAAIIKFSATSGVNSIYAGGGVLAMAGAVVLIMYAIKELADMPLEKYESGLKRVAIILAGLLGLSFLMGKFKGGMDWHDALGLFLFVVSMQKILDLMEQISEMPLSKIFKAAILLILVTLELKTLMTAGKGLAKGSGGSIMLTVASLWLFVKVLEDLADEDYNKVYAAMTSLIGVFLALGYLGIVAKAGGTKIRGLGSALAGMGIAILAMALAAKLLGEMDDWAFVKGAACVALFSKLILEFTKLAPKVNKNVKDLGNALLKFAVAIGIMGLVAYLVGQMDEEQLIKGVGTVTVFGILLIALTTAIGYAGKARGATKVIAGVGILLAEIAVIFYLLSTFGDASEYLTIAESIALVLAALSLCALALSASKGKAWQQAIAAAGGAALMLVAVAGVFILLDKFDCAPAMETAGALSLVLLSLAVVAGVLSVAKVDFATGLQTVGVLDAFLISLFGIFDAFAAINKHFNISAEDIQGVCDSFVAIMTALGTGLGNFVGGFVGGTIGTMLSEIGAGLESFTERVGSFLTLIKGLGDDHLTGAKNLAKVITEIVKAAATDDKMLGGSHLDKFGNQLTTFGIKLVNFISKLTSGEGGISKEQVETAIDAIGALTVLNEFTDEMSGLVEFSQIDFASMNKGLVDFGTAIIEFSKVMDGESDAGELHIGAIRNAVPGVQELGKLIKAFPSDVSAITSFANYEFETGLLGFGTAMVKYGMIVAGKTDAGTYYGGAIANSIPGAIKLFDLLNVVPPDGGLLQDIFGHKNWSNVSKGLADFGEALVTFSNTVKGDNTVDAAAIENAVAGAQKLSDLKNSFNGVGGVIDYIIGRKDWESWMTGLRQFGLGLVRFSNIAKVDGAINTPAIQNAVDAANILVELQKAFPETGGILDKIFGGEMDWATFASQLVAFGTALFDFSEVAKSIDTLKFYTVTSAVEKVMILVDDEHYGQYDKLVKVSATLTKFGEDMRDLTTTFSQIDTTKFSEVSSNIISAILNIGNEDTTASTATMSQMLLDNILLGLTSNTEGLMAVGTQLIQGIYDGASIYHEQFMTLGRTYATEFYTSFEMGRFIAKVAGQTVAQYLYDGLKFNEQQIIDLGVSYGNAFAENLDMTTDPANTAGENVSGAAIEGLNENDIEFENAGKDHGVNYSGGITQMEGEATGAANFIGTSAASTLNELRAAFFAAGANAAQGFVDGIRSKAGEVAAAARELGQIASAALSVDALDEHSPSRVFLGFGALAAEGFAIGLSSNNTSVTENAESLGNSAVDAMQNVVSKINDAINSDMDLTPTIQPMLDLSNIKAGAGQINSLIGSRSFSMAGSISANNAAAAKPQTLTSANQNGGTQFNFTQNNYSPKALSRLEIYRNTRNQFAQLKGLVDS